jgi:hypothetical protein
VLKVPASVTSAADEFAGRCAQLYRAAGVALAAGQGSGTAAQSAPPQLDFDFDNGNFIRDLVTTNAGGELPSEDAVGPMDAVIYTWITHLFMMSWFDALAPYHPTAVGFCSRIPRRPASESTTNRNKNIAALHASYQVVKTMHPERVAGLRMGLTAIGLDVEDESEDPTTPVGIGNLVGKGAVGAHLRDGMNFLGDEGRKYNGLPFDDYTGYQPVNSAYELVNASRWQPAMHPHARRVGGGPGDKGIWVIQRFVTPQMARVRPFTYRDPSRFRLAPPVHLDHTRRSLYKHSVDEVLEASAALTDEQKVKTEFFDDKFQAIGLSTMAAAEAHNLELDDWIQLFFTSAVAQFDDLIAAWYQKVKYDTTRPFSAIRHVYGDTPVTAWGGPGKGTVTDMPANEWASYIPVGDHPDYPSGSTTLCAAEAQAARRFLNSDVLDWTIPVPAGSALTEPGIVPASDMTLHYPTWTEFTQDCAMSRVWAGVHFKKTVERSLEFGKQFGDRAYEFARRHITGNVRG